MSDTARPQQTDRREPFTRDDLPRRAGPRPATTDTNPHTQLDQQPEAPLSQEIEERVGRLAGVVLAPSRRAPPNTTGFYLKPEYAEGPADGFMLKTEFAHLHPVPDVSLHLTLPEPIRTQAIEKGWAEPHPLAGQPTISHLIVLLYAPRDRQELAVVHSLIEASWAYARTGSVSAA
ncbi:luciferase family protein [Salinicola halophilus]|uniref:luciferase domain-containing protein n=1 Tax=Salinicola halophilus TaxID=184065 RepID=UPI000DA1B928|nr:luciferase family protein [Salinicola halophilus]